jgi:hypothetical protein
MQENIDKRAHASTGGRLVAGLAHCAAGAFMVLGLGITLTVPAAASQLVFDRGLPTANLNNIAGTNRSNVSWADDGATSIGDNFTLSAPANYLINDIRVWVVGSSATLNPNFFGLWFGADTGDSTKVSYIGQSSSVFATTYSNGSNYQSDTNEYTLYQVDFTGLNLLRPDGTYAFGVTGVTDPGLVTTPFLSASNAALSGSPQGAPTDGLIYAFDASGAMASGYPSNSSLGWDKTSDINVQVFADVPEPASMLVLSVGALVAGIARRRRG